MKCHNAEKFRVLQKYVMSADSRALPVDNEGNRIRTDILTSGYIRQEIEEKLELLIPSDIKQLCFVYWFINVCDEWDIKYTNDKYQVNGQCLKLFKSGDGFDDFLNFGQPSAFGTHSVEGGTFLWRIKFNTDVKWICLGVIQDDETLFIKHANDGNHDFNDYGGSFWNGGGYYSHDQRGGGYGSTFGDKGDIITIILDMDKHTIGYKINDKDYGVASNTMNKDKYRLIVNYDYQGVNGEIELL